MTLRRIQGGLAGRTAAGHGTQLEPLQKCLSLRGSPTDDVTHPHACVHCSDCVIQQFPYIAAMGRRAYWPRRLMLPLDSSFHWRVDTPDRQRGGALTWKLPMRMTKRCAF